jgi:hypothetical protein
VWSPRGNSLYIYQCFNHLRSQKLVFLSLSYSFHFIISLSVFSSSSSFFSSLAATSSFVDLFSLWHKHSSGLYIIYICVCINVSYLSIFCLLYKIFIIVYFLNYCTMMMMMILPSKALKAWYMSVTS